VTLSFNAKQDKERVESDTDLNGSIDTWEYYQHGKLARMQKDHTGDGKPDLCEEHDKSEALVKRSRDLNFDGEPDTVDTPSGKKYTSAEG